MCLRFLVLPFHRVALIPVLLALVAACSGTARASHVTFDAAGIAQVDGRPFFPVGLFTYSLDDQVYAEAHDLQFNTVIMLTEHHHPDSLR